MKTYRGTESECRGPEWITAVGSGLGERSGTWQSTAMWAETGKINQVHIIYTETPGDHEVKCVSYDMTRPFDMLSHAKRMSKTDKARGLHKSSCLKPEFSLKTVINTDIDNTESKTPQQILAPFGVGPPQNKPVCICASVPLCLMTEPGVDRAGHRCFILPLLPPGNQRDEVWRQSRRGDGEHRGRREGRGAETPAASP